MWAINGSQNNLIPVLEFKFNCKSLVVGYDIEMFVFPFLLYDDALFYQDGYTTFGAYQSVISFRARISI